MSGEATPTDGRFRRGVYVMFVVVGLLAAGAQINARRSASDMTAAERAARSAQADAAMARRQLADVLAAQAAESRAAAAREARAVAQRQEADVKLDALERFTAALLAASGTTQQRRVYAAIITAPSASASASASPAPSPSRPASSPKPSATPSSSPSPTSCRVYSPVSGRCVLLGS